MSTQFSFKDFENVRLKATYDMRVGNRNIIEGETIVVFDKIQIAQLTNVLRTVSANGGFDNRAHVFWTTAKEEHLEFAQGVLSKQQFSILLNAKLVELSAGTPLEVTCDEYLESNEQNQITLAREPLRDIFVYDIDTGARVTNFQRDDKVITLTSPYQSVLVTYVYNYESGAQVYELGRQLINGFVSLEGRTRVKDDTTGQVVTGIIKIPKLKLMSNLSMRLGAQATPFVGNFSAIAVPVGSRGDSYISEFCLLHDDIDSDL